MLTDPGGVPRAQASPHRSYMHRLGAGYTCGVMLSLWPHGPLSQLQPLQLVLNNAWHEER